MALLTTPSHLDRFARQAAESIPAGAMVLDAGAGDAPYRTYFQSAKYEATDHCKRDSHKYLHVDYVCDLRSIPVEKERYDLVLCTQVLEHVPWPREVLGELNRVLKLGGTLWISAPLMFEEHEVPHDFFRYTRYAWQHMLVHAGFRVESLEWVSGYYGTLGHQLNIARRALPWRARDYGGGVVGWLGVVAAVAAKPIFLGLAIIFSRLDLRHKFTSAGSCMDYCIKARKVSEAPANPSADLNSGGEPT